MENSIEDINQLNQLNDLLKDIVFSLSAKILAEYDLKIVILEHFMVYEIDSKLSWENKLIELFKKMEDLGKNNIKEYLKLEGQIKSLRMQKEQVEEAIKSKKTIINIRPR